MSKVKQTKDTLNSIQELSDFLKIDGEEKRRLGAIYRELIGNEELDVPPKIQLLFNLYEYHKHFMRKVFGYPWHSESEVQEESKAYKDNLDALNALFKEVVHE